MGFRVRPSKGYYYLQAHPSWVSDVNAIFQAAYSPEFYRSVSSDVTIVGSDDWKQMADIVGSGFVPGKVFICNPCFSQKREMTAASVTVGEDSPPDGTVVDSYVSYNRYVGTYTAQASIAGEIGVPKGLYAHLQSAYLSTHTATEYEHLYSDAFAQIQDGAIDLLTTIAEMQKTISSIASIAIRLGQIVKSVKRRDFSFLRSNGVKETANTAANQWLEARYAVRPLMYDIRNSLRAMASDGKLSEIRKAYKTDVDETSNEVEFSFSENGITYYAVGVVSTTVSAKAGCYARLNLDLPFVDNLGLSNIASTAWELVPWSFVVNWFVNTSGLIASMNPNPIYKVETGFISVKTEHEYAFTVSANVNGSDYSYPISGTQSTYHRIAKTVPQLINLNVNLSIPKLIDLLAFSRSVR